MIDILVPTLKIRAFQKNQRDEWLKSEIDKVQQQVKRCNDDFTREQEDIREIRRQNQTRNDQFRVSKFSK